MSKMVLLGNVPSQRGDPSLSQSPPHGDNNHDDYDDDDDHHHHLRNLVELTQIVDELIDDYIHDVAIKNVSDYLSTALDCCSQYRRSIKSSPISYEEIYIYYNAASRIITQLIPSLIELKDMKESLKTVYSEIIEFLNKNRLNYENVTNHIKNHSQNDNSDPLLKRFEQLKMGKPTVSDVSVGHPVVTTLPVITVNYDKFSTKHCLSINELSQLLEFNSNDILIIDIRRKKEFESDHIDLTMNTIQIEPVSIRVNYSCADIEHFSLSTNTDEERELFIKRNQFELIIIIDTNSTMDQINEGTKRLIDILKFKNNDKPLKRQPVLLQGGFNEWANQFTHDINLPSFNQGTMNHSSSSSNTTSDLFTSHHGQFISPVDYSKPVISRRSSIQSNHDIYQDSPVTYNFNEKEYIKNISEYFAAPKRSLSSGASPRPDVSYLQQQSSLKGATPFYKNPPNFLLSSSPSQQVLPPLPPPPPVPLPPSSYSLSKPKPVVYSQDPTSQLIDERPRNLPPRTITNQQLRFEQHQSPEDLNIMTGLANLGNSCYMNCSLQCLIGTKKLDEFFLNGSYRKHINLNSRLGSKGILANGYASLLNESYIKWKNSKKSSRSSYIIPTNFRKIISSLNSNFRNTDQQDCSEFLNYIIDNLHEDLNENGNHPKLPELTSEEEEFRENLPIRIASTIEWEKYLKTNFSIIVDIFQGQYLSRLKCLTCNKTSTTYNPFSTLSLPIPENKSSRISLNRCFQEFVSPEVLDGDDRWFCPRCKAKTKSTKTLQIARLPQVLIVHLKRFQMVNYLSKIDTFIDYPLDLKLDDYWYPYQNEMEFQEAKKLPMRGQLPPFNYKLFGVINHFGNLITGHYTSFVNKSEADGWCYFDDTKITKNCPLSKVVNKDAYVLFYVRV